MSKYFNKQERKKLCFNKMGKNYGCVFNFTQVRFDKIKGKKEYFLELNITDYKENKKGGFYCNQSYKFKIFDKTKELLKIRAKLFKMNDYSIFENEVRNLFYIYGEK